MQERVPMARQFQDYESGASGTEYVEISPTAAYIEKAAVHVADYLRGRADRRRARAEERVAYDSYAENIVAGDHASKNPNARTAGYDTTSDNAEEFFASFRADRAKKDERWMNGKPAEPNSTEGRRYDRKEARNRRQKQRSLGVMAVFSAVLAGAAEYTRTRAALSEEAQTY